VAIFIAGNLPRAPNHFSMVARSFAVHFPHALRQQFRQQRIVIKVMVRQPHSTGPKFFAVQGFGCRVMRDRQA
jgi:hypothetical protein